MPASADFLLVRFDRVGRIQFANEAFCALAGINHERLISGELEMHADRISLSGWSAVRQALLQLAPVSFGSAPSTISLDDCELGGEPHALTLQAEPGESGCVLLVGRSSAPLLRLQQRNESLRRSMRDLLDSAQESIHVIDIASGRYVDMNTAGLRMLNTTREELDRFSVLQVSAPVQDDGLPPEQSLARRHQELLANGGYYEGFWRIVDPATGEERVHEIHVSLIEGRNQIRVMELDVTDRMRAEQALRASEENLRVTLNSIADAVITTDAESRVVIINPVAQRLTGWSAEQAVGQPLAQVLHLRAGDQRQPRLQIVDRIMSMPQGMLLPEGTELIARDGAVRSVTGFAVPIHRSSRDVSGAVITLRDVSDDLRVQRQLQRTENLRVIGQLASGVAHDFNNILNVVGGAAELVGADPASSLSAGSRHLLDTALDAVQRGEGLTARLLAFGSGAKMQRESLSLHELISGTRRIVEPTLAPGVQLKLGLAAVQERVRGDRSQLENVLLNIIINANHAVVADLDAGGVIAVNTRNLMLVEGAADDDFFRYEPGRFAQVEIVDTGIGMTPDALQNIFKPFFTTRAEQGGTGLGLAAVRGIVRDHGGFLQVESEPGVGSIFRIALPCSD